MTKLNNKTILEGASSNGAKRMLEVIVNNKGKTEIWIKPPNSDGGYWIEVSTVELKEALKIKN